MRGTRRFSRIAIGVGLFFYVVYGIVDVILFREHARLLLLIRFSGFVPAALLALVTTFFSVFDRLRSAIATALVMTAGCSMALMIVIAPPPLNYSYYPGLVIAFLFGYTFSKLLLGWASIAGWGIIVFYNVATVFSGRFEPAIFISDNVIFFTANLTGMFTAYSIEYFARRDFSRRRQLAREREEERSVFALCVIDIDRFKQINDTLGHHRADAILQIVAKRVRRALRSIDLVVRQGGDEFAMVLPGVSSEEAVRPVLERVFASVRRRVVVEGFGTKLTTSCGVAVFPDHATTHAELFRCADSAMYEAKAQGRNTICFFDHALGNRIMDHTRIEQLLRNAIENGGLSLVYQPKVSIGDETVAERRRCSGGTARRKGRSHPESLFRSRRTRGSCTRSDGG